MANPVETIKREKHGFDVWPDVLAHARAKTPQKEIPSSDLERMKWYGVFYRKRDTPGSYMLRIRITGNELSAPAAKEIARIAYELGYGIVDVTTRANIQVQGLDIAGVPRALQRLEAVGLTAKQTGLDNVRNVFAHPLAGVDPEELIDTRQLCRDVTRVFLDHRELADLPRKFNIALCGRPSAGIHYWTQDLAFLAAQWGDRVGFRVLVGGKQGQTPQLGKPLPIFVPPELVCDVTRTVLELFRTTGSREKRDSARFHFLLERIGLEGVMRALCDALGTALVLIEEAEVPLTLPTGYDDLVGWFPQKEPGLWAMGLCPALGRMSWMQLEGVAVASQRWADGQLRTTPEQGLVVLNVRTNLRDALATHVARWNLSVHADSRVRNTVACTGKQFCNIAVTETKAHALRLIEQLRVRALELHGIHVHMSGCPSSCANHHTADIGLKGVRVKRLLGTREGFDVFLAGGVAGRMQLAQPYRMGVDVDQLPNLIEEVVREYYLRHQPGQTFSDYWRDELRRRQAATAGEHDYRPPVWECDQCNHRHVGEDPPVYCPSCAALRRHFARWEEGGPEANSNGQSPELVLTADGYVMAADLAAVPTDRGLLVQLGGQEIALFRVGDAVHALDNCCPHTGGALAEGTMADGCVTCPLHGWKFETQSGAPIAPAKRGVTAYPVKVEDGKVLVQMGGRSA